MGATGIIISRGEELFLFFVFSFNERFDERFGVFVRRFIVTSLKDLKNPWIDVSVDLGDDHRGVVEAACTMEDDFIGPRFFEFSACDFKDRGVSDAQPFTGEE